MEIKDIPVSYLRFYKNNPRINDQAVESVAASIKEFGFKVPIIVDKDNTIICGHTRAKAAMKLCLLKVPCIVADDLTPEQIKAFRLIDNKTAELSDWDFSKLEKELVEIGKMNLDFDMQDFGFDFSEMEEPHEIIEDEVPEVDEESEPIVQLGDIWQLGRHKLICGDSTDKATVERLMDGKKADMVFTDPPYGVSATGGRSQTKEKLNMKAIVNDDLRDSDLIEFLIKFISAMPYKDNASIYICYPWQTQEEFTKAIKQSELQIKNCIIWNKKVFGLNGHKGYRPQYEMIYFCCKNDIVWYGNNAQSNVWEISREIKREEQGNHPTPKPIALIEKAICNSSKKGDIVLDSFGGSGSTLIACEQLGRRCYMMELDPRYCDVIIKRWETLTGQKAVKIER